jgi:transposase-like protein
MLPSRWSSRRCELHMVSGACYARECAARTRRSRRLPAATRSGRKAIVQLCSPKPACTVKPSSARAALLTSPPSPAALSSHSGVDTPLSAHILLWSIPMSKRLPPCPQCKTFRLVRWDYAVRSGPHSTTYFSCGSCQHAWSIEYGDERKRQANTAPQKTLTTHVPCPQCLSSLEVELFNLSENGGAKVLFRCPVCGYESFVAPTPPTHSLRPRLLF